MIFIATNADASSNNLGKVSIKTINDVRQETYEVIAAYGNKSFTDDQIIAIDDFLVQLKNLPTYSRFSYCVLPILAPQTTFLNDNSAWKDINPCYDIINKVRLTPGGYNGYVDNHGIRKGAQYGSTVVIQNISPISVNPSIFTMGVGEAFDASALGYLMNVNKRLKTLSFGASDKVMNIDCSDVVTEDLPFVGVGSRSETEVHAAVNGKVCNYSGELKEPYATNPYSMKHAAAISYPDKELDRMPCSFVFFCKDYMMTDDELLAVNKIFYDLMVALW